MAGSVTLEVRPREIAFLRLLLAVSAISLILNVVQYFRLGDLSFPRTEPVATAGMTPNEKLVASMEFGQRAALESIQAVTLAGLKDRAFQNANWSLILLALSGYLNWRVRTTRRIE